MWEHKCLKETDIALINKSMQNIEKKVDEWFSDIKQELKEMKNSFAWKWVEKVLIWVWITIWTPIIWALIYLVIKR